MKKILHSLFGIRILLLLCMPGGYALAQSSIGWFDGTCTNFSSNIRYAYRCNSGISNQPFRLIYNDEFDGTAINTNDWATYYPYTSPDDRTKPEGPVVFRDENVTVDNGILTLQVKSEPNPQPYGSKNGDFTGGLIYSKNQYLYGRFEIRCQMPRGTCGWMGQPLWSSFWLIGGNCGTSEIDVLEVNDSHHRQEYWDGLSYGWTYTADHLTLYTSLHGQPYNTHPSTRGVECKDCEGHSPHDLPNSFSRVNFQKDPRVTGITNGYHIYAVEWEPSRIVWFYDGVEVNRYYRYVDMLGNPCGENSCATCISNPLWPDSPLNIVAELKMGDEGIDGTATLPASYNIDYIRVYQRIPIDDPKHLCGGTLNSSPVAEKKAICGPQDFTAAFRLPTTGINWTCSSNLVLSSTTGNTVTVTPVSANLTEPGWIAAEPIFQNGTVCTSAEGKITKNFWIGLPISYSDLYALLHNSPQNPAVSCQSFNLCAYIPGASLMGATYDWTTMALAPHRALVNTTQMDSVQGKVAPTPGPGTDPGCGCVHTSDPCISGEWYAYPGTNPAAPYTLSITNECGTVTISDRIYRPLSCPPNTSNPPGGEQPRQVSFYPNPANASLLVKGAEENAKSTLYLSNAYGKIVFTSSLTSADLIIDTKEMPAGIYTLKVVGADIITTNKVLIDHESFSNPITH
ncbi:family 16 glycosylhydrolase [Hymenobacter ruricola]|uniref:Family 16 glycosylhydrolase n=1 Tax=Hymenobacter ruricola TaxID=2791023 RepID=A0ABS0I9P7_9BACT|nr:family 16 glycosylhydrolase [Hymenobacter ruricola]MBF9223244.1 family 16 glycosylhydrolase [Hymenobacter ruricola]